MRISRMLFFHPLYISSHNRTETKYWSGKEIHMMKQTILTLGLSLVFAAMCSAQAPQPSSDRTSCSDARVSSGLNVCFDGISGTFYGSHRFLRRDTVRVWVCNFEQGTKYA